MGKYETSFIEAAASILSLFHSAWINTVFYTPKIIDYLSQKSSLLALAGIIISVFTLREMAKERRESYRPRLVFKNRNIFLQKNSNGTPCFLKQNPEVENSLFCPSFFLELNNIGLGSAHNLTITWDYNHDEIVKRFKNYSTKTKLIHSNDNNHFEYMFSEDSQDGYGFFIREPNEEKIELAFLRNNDSVEVKVPQTIHSYITFSSYLELVKQNFPRRAEIRLDEIEIQFDYFDIGGEKHTQLLKMVFEVYAFADEDANKNFGAGNISFSIK